MKVLRLNEIEKWEKFFRLYAKKRDFFIINTFAMLPEKKTTPCRLSINVDGINKYRGGGV
jgi:hypothetical protein